MTIALEDISMTEELDRKALTAVRGGDLAHPVTMPGEGYLPPSLPIAFPFPIRFPDFPIRLPDVCPGGDGGTNFRVTPI
jgi:hypothetical protein